MSRFNVSQNHPLITNSQEYLDYRKYVSIHSEDRDITKYPNSNEFEIELPQDYLNVSSVRLSTWSFPSNYNTFSFSNGNTTLTFKFNNLYNPGEHGLANPLQDEIFSALYNYKNPVLGTNEFLVIIQDGFYNPTQLSTELTNRMNYIVTQYLKSSIDPAYLTEFISQGGYTDFVVAYNEVGQTMWFGNRSSSFTLTNQTQLNNKQITNSLCIYKSTLPDFSDYGLASNLGFNPCNVSSITTSDIDSVRFYYGSVNAGDNGYWLTPNPDLPGSQISFIKPLYKLNIMGPAYFYMEISSLNNIDETSPFALNEFTKHTNETNGIVNAAFAKIPITTTPLAQWFDVEMVPYKQFVPPAERMRKLKIKLRYHNGAPVDFGKFNYSFTLEFKLLNNQIKRDYNVFDR